MQLVTYIRTSPKFVRTYVYTYICGMVYCWLTANIRTYIHSSVPLAIITVHCVYILHTFGNCVGKTSKSKLQSHPANSLLGMMSSYHSDDEDDHMVDSEDKVVDETESSRVTLETTGSKQSQLDEQVADFLQVSVSLETVVFKISVCV